MDKNTLSNYGWIVVTVLILAVMLALATPFGEFVAGAFKSTYVGFGNVTDKAFGVIGLDTVTPDDNGGTGGEQGGTETPDETQTIYTAYHYGATSVFAWYGGGEDQLDDTFGITNTTGLSPYFIIDKAMSKMSNDGHGNGMGSYWDDTTRCLIVPEADFKAYALQAFVSISDAEWEAVKNVNSVFKFEYDNGNFVFQMPAMSWYMTYIDNAVSYTNNGDGTFDVYRTVLKCTETTNPYNLFNEADYGSYEEYDAAVQQYMTDNGIGYNGMDDYYYTTSTHFNYVITYQCEGLTNFKIYDSQITSPDEALTTNLKIKSTKMVDVTTGSALAQPSRVEFVFYYYEKDGNGYGFRVFPENPDVAIACDWCPAVSCGCTEYTLSGKTLTCKCGSTVFTETEYVEDYDDYMLIWD